MNGHDLYSSAEGADLVHADDLFAPAAQKVFEETDPYNEPSKCLEIAKRIISDRPQTDQSVPWAHYLSDFMLINQHKPAEAIAGFRKAIELDPLIEAQTANASAGGISGEFTAVPLQNIVLWKNRAPGHKLPQSRCQRGFLLIV